MIVGLCFIVVVTFLHGSSDDCGFTTILLHKASGLTYIRIMGKNHFLMIN